MASSEPPDSILLGGVAYVRLGAVPPGPGEPSATPEATFTEPECPQPDDPDEEACLHLTVTEADRRRLFPSSSHDMNKAEDLMVIRNKMPQLCLCLRKLKVDCDVTRAPQLLV